LSHLIGAEQLEEERHVLTFSKRFNTIQRITEFAANLALVIAVAVGVTVWLRRPNTAGPSHNTSVAGPVSQYSTLGTQIVLPGVDWSAHKATLVVAISSACHYCVASTPFYSAITHSTHVAPIVVVMPQGEQDAQTFLSKHAISPRNVVSANLASIQVNATPTLLLVSSSGIVTKEWVGELTNTQRHDVIQSLDQI
jgi:hypothetical protein